MLRTLRRVKQLTYLLVSPEFRTPEALQGQSLRRYDSETEVRHYRATAGDGLRYEELGALRDFFSVPADSSRALVVGAGCGREAFAIAALGQAVTAIDLSPMMIANARELAGGNPRLKFQVSSFENFETTERFALVFVSAAIAEHIYGAEARRHFYEKARDLLLKNGRIFVFPAIQKLGARSPYFWASQLLRLRWATAGLDWQEGDSARAFYGRHNRDFKPVFYHFYPDREAFEQELTLSGLAILFEFEGAFVLKRASA
jgi:SAM-dependent methyltransferase